VLISANSLEKNLKLRINVLFNARNYDELDIHEEKKVAQRTEEE
jgi:hypothetical protein